MARTGRRMEETARPRLCERAQRKDLRRKPPRLTGKAELPLELPQDGKKILAGHLSQLILEAIPYPLCRFSASRSSAPCSRSASCRATSPLSRLLGPAPGAGTDLRGGGEVRLAVEPRVVGADVAAASPALSDAGPQESQAAADIADDAEAPEADRLDLGYPERLVDRLPELRVASVPQVVRNRCRASRRPRHPDRDRTGLRTPP